MPHGTGTHADERKKWENINFISPRDAIVVANRKWEDDEISDISFTDQVGGVLEPGEELTAAEITSTNEENEIAVKAVGVTQHPNDIDGDGTDENTVEYSFQAKPYNPSDRFNELPGLTTTLPLGSLGQPSPLVEGSYVGPMSAFRIVVRNRSDEFSNPQSVDIEKIGAEIHGRVLRNVDGVGNFDATFYDIFGEGGE